MSETKLSARQRYWFEHLTKAEERGVTLVAYAREQELKVNDLYQWKATFIKRGVMRPSVACKDFLPVPVSAPTTSCRVHLANGARIEFPEPLSLQTIEGVLQALHRLA